MAITCYAATCKTDFTIYAPILWIVGFLFLTASLFSFAFGLHNNLLFSTFGALLFSFYLLFDTQTILGGQDCKYQIDEDSYILAAVMLYLDIINIFLYILSILGKK